MKKRMKNLQIKRNNHNSFIILIAVLSALTFASGKSLALAEVSPVNAPNLQSQQPVTTQTTQTTKTNQINIQQPEQPVPVPENNSVQTNLPTGLKTTQPVEQRGLKFGIIKFVMGMLGVLVSSFAIFFGLKMYKKFALKDNVNQETIDYDKTLESPKNFKEAINLFLDKTDKK